MRHREVARLKSVVDGLLPLVDDHGRIHTTFNQTIAATGRLSSTDPNLQNIPVRTAEGRRIRETFTVGEGYESLMTADYSQIEMRIMAHLSKDAGLIEAFQSGEDLHTFVASRAFDIPTADVDPELRRRIKAMSYGLAYGLSAFGLSRQLKITADEARGHMDAYFTRFGGVRDYLRSVVEDARQTGFTETIMGRRRYLTNLTSDNRNLREMAERAALNAPIQGSAADIIKVAMLGVHRGLADAGLRSRLLLQVHDELVLEIAPGEREAVEALVCREMGGAYALDVPMDVSVGVGRTWHDAAHYASLAPGRSATPGRSSARRRGRGRSRRGCRPAPTAPTSWRRRRCAGMIRAAAPGRDPAAASTWPPRVGPPTRHRRRRSGPARCRRASRRARRAPAVRAGARGTGRCHAIRRTAGGCGRRSRPSRRRCRSAGTAPRRRPGGANLPRCLAATADRRAASPG